MRTISADYIFPVSSPPIKNGVVVVDDNGTVLEVTNQQSQDAEVFKGVIVPGFVNTHCHLELSYLKGKINEGKGLTGFFSELLPIRNKTSEEVKISTIKDAEEQMICNGIVAVGDISNTSHSFRQKKEKKISYHTFIEVFDILPERAAQVFENAKALSAELLPLASTIVPHTSYTVSEKLLQLIDEKKQKMISVHNQETSSEDEFFISGTGKLAELMQKSGVVSKKTGSSSMHYILSRITNSKKILLVHNTYTTREDILWLKSRNKSHKTKIFLCLCPNANLYIENRLPDIPMFLKEEMNLCIGTDSLASNHSLSVLEELKTISKHFPKIPFETLIRWTTKNGAEFLGMEKEIGTIEKGKKPGLNLLKGISIDKIKFSEKTSVKKLI